MLGQLLVERYNIRVLLMKNSSSFVHSFMLIIGDFLAIMAAFTVAYIFRVQLDTRPLADQIPAFEYARIFIFLSPVWLLVFGLLGLYRKEIYSKILREFGLLLVGSIIGIMAVITYDFIVDEPIFPARLVPVYALLIGYLLLLLVRTLLRIGRQLAFRVGYGINNIIIVGNNDTTSDIARALLNTNETGYKIVGIWCAKDVLDPQLESLRLDNFQEAIELIENTDIHTVLQTEFYADESRNRTLIDTAQANHCAYKFIPATSIQSSAKTTIELFANLPVVSVHATPLIGWGRIAKRLFDIIGASLGLLLSLPIIIVVGLIIKLRDPKGGVFYRHTRVSRFGKEFRVYKLRSMFWKYSPGAGTNKSEVELFEEMGRPDLVDEWKKNQKVTNDPRIMGIGNFIRRTSIDELPQLWNVIKGEISLIGPRPVTKSELDRYEKTSALFLSIKPGITGLWQVSGRNTITYEERIALELFYIQNWSFWLDIKIVYWTIVSMIKGRGQ